MPNRLSRPVRLRRPSTENWLLTRVRPLCKGLLPTLQSHDATVWSVEAPYPEVPMYVAPLVGSGNMTRSYPCVSGEVRLLQSPRRRREGGRQSTLVPRATLSGTEDPYFQG